MAAQQNTQPRAYSAAHFGLELDNDKKTVGMFRSVEGGGVTAEVMNYQMGENYDVWRQLGKPKYEDFKIQCGMSMSFSFYAWIAQFFNGQGTRKSGAIVAADFFYVERARREFDQAMITELAFPKLDGSDKNAAYMTVTVAPEKMVFKKGTQQKLQYDTKWSEQKLWTACNFRFVIDGFEQALKRTTKVDGFSIKQKVIDYHIGERREPIKVPSRIEWPNISFYVPEVDAQPLLDAFSKQAMQEKPEPVMEGFRGHIETFDNQNDTLFTIQMYGLHIKSAAPDKSDSGSEEIKQVKFEMGVEKMEFEWKFGLA